MDSLSRLVIRSRAFLGSSEIANPVIFAVSRHINAIWLG